MTDLHTYFFYLHKWCIPVKGILRSTICDFQREKMELIPNEMCDILQKYNGRKIEEIFTAYQEIEGSSEVIIEYFDLLISKEFLYLSKEEDKNLSSIEMNTQNKSPYHINSCIIDFNTNSDHPMESIMNELNFLGCKAIQFRFYDEISIEYLKTILDLTNNTLIRNVSVMLKYVSSPHYEELKKLLEKDYYRVMDVILHSAPKKEIQYEKLGKKRLVFASNAINDCSACGVISPFYFDKSYYTYIIGQNNNTCLYKKISINTEGELKNCPSVKESLGNISTMTIGEAVLNPKLKKLWNITKDQIKTCKTCEFRLVCTDCRAYLNDENDIYSKPKKCSYNPETAVWE